MDAARRATLAVQRCRICHAPDGRVENSLDSDAADYVADLDEAFACVWRFL